MGLKVRTPERVTFRVTLRRVWGASLRPEIRRSSGKIIYRGCCDVAVCHVLFELIKARNWLGHWFRFAQGSTSVKCDCF